MTEVEDFQDVDSPHIVINAAFSTFLSYTAIMLNIITIYALRKTSSLPESLKTLFLSLAVSDLSVGLLVEPLNVAYLAMRLKKNTKNNRAFEITKDVFDATATFLCCASFFCVTALTVDRFLAIHVHLRYQELVTQRRVVAVVILIWLLSVVFSPLWLWNPKMYSTVIGTIPAVCLILTTFSYCKIYLAVRRHTNQIQALQAQNYVVVTNTARQIKSAVGTFYVHLVFLVCFLPHLSINAAYTIKGERIPRDTLWDYTVTLVYLNSSLNPLVYCWKLRHIRHAIMNILRNMFSRETTH